jgi:hypothetical protein
MFGLLDGDGTPHYAGAGQSASGSSAGTVTAGAFGNGTPHYLGAGQPANGATSGIFGFLSGFFSGTRPVYQRGPSSSSGQVVDQEVVHQTSADAGQPAAAAAQPMQPAPAATPVVVQHS